MVHKSITEINRKISRGQLLKANFLFKSNRGVAVAHPQHKTSYTYDLSFATGCLVV